MELIILILVIFIVVLIILGVCMFFYELGGNWSTVKKGKKPIGWWFHKILCEGGILIALNVHSYLGNRIYYYHLNVMCKKYKINLYGEKH